MSSTHDAYAALRHRDYRCLLSAAVLGSIGESSGTSGEPTVVISRRADHVMPALLDVCTKTRLLSAANANRQATGVQSGNITVRRSLPRSGRRR